MVDTASSATDGRTSPSPKRRAKLWIAGGLIAVLIPALIVWGLGRPGAASFYMTVAEVRGAGESLEGRDYRVNGTVVPGSIETRGLRTEFVVTDGDADMTVVTEQPLPDTFKDGSEVVVRGEPIGQSFMASEVLAKCPSKFKAKS